MTPDERSKQWRENNPEKAKECARRYSKNNRDKENARRRRWAENNPEKEKEWRKTSYKNGWVSRYWEKKAQELKEKGGSTE